MLEKFENKIKKSPKINIQIQKGDITKINFPDNTFDVALAPNIIHLLDNPEKALNELKRIVKKGGIIIIPTYITKQENKTMKNIGKALFKLVRFNSNSWTEKEYIEILKKK